MLDLEGITILDLTQLGRGSFCTMILGDLGTELSRGLMNCVKRG